MVSGFGFRYLPTVGLENGVGCLSQLKNSSKLRRLNSAYLVEKWQSESFKMLWQYKLTL